jgi:hypothetical protein
MAQGLHHQESAMMQYDLRQRAIALGWAPEAIEVIDEDQARSGTTTDGRSGFVCSTSTTCEQRVASGKNATRVRGLLPEQFCLVKPVCGCEVGGYKGGGGVPA